MCVSKDAAGYALASIEGEREAILASVGKAIASSVSLGKTVGESFDVITEDSSTIPL